MVKTRTGSAILLTTLLSLGAQAETSKSQLKFTAQRPIWSCRTVSKGNSSPLHPPAYLLTLGPQHLEAAIFYMKDLKSRRFEPISKTSLDTRAVLNMQSYLPAGAIPIQLVVGVFAGSDLIGIAHLSSVYSRSAEIAVDLEFSPEYLADDIVISAEMHDIARKEMRADVVNDLSTSRP